MWWVAKPTWTTAGSPIITIYGRITLDSTPSYSDLDNRRLSFSLNGSWGRPMGTCSFLENIDYVVGLTPGFTMQAPCTMQVNLGYKPFKHAPRSGAAPVAAWLDDRRARYIDLKSHQERLQELRFSLQEVNADPHLTPEQQAHARRLLDAGMREVLTRSDPSKAQQGVALSSQNLSRTLTYAKAIRTYDAGGSGDSGSSGPVRLRTSSGRQQTVIGEDQEVHVRSKYPSVVGEVSLLLNIAFMSIYGNNH